MPENLWSGTYQAYDALAIHGRRGLRVPQGWEILSQVEDRLMIGPRQDRVVLALPLRVISFHRFDRAELRFPVLFKVACDEPVFGLDRIVLSLGPLGLKARPLTPQLPLAIQHAGFAFELLEGVHR